jgi:hypothetical protein
VSIPSRRAAASRKKQKMANWPIPFIWKVYRHSSRGL